jgi:hypothetical protein
MSPEVMIHAIAGGVGLISGAVTLSARKGERLHRRAGTVFFFAMIAAALSAVALAFRAGDMTLVVAGSLTVYFIGTSWLTVKQPERTAGWPLIAACAFAFAGSAAAAYYAYDSVQKGTALLGGIPFYGFATVAALCALLDITVIARRGLAGRQRIARHLWRMCLGFFIAVGSFFPGQDQFFPDWVMNTEPVILLFIPAFSVIGVMLVWLIIVLFTRWYDQPQEAQA